MYYSDWLCVLEIRVLAKLCRVGECRFYNLAVNELLLAMIWGGTAHPVSTGILFTAGHIYPVSSSSQYTIGDVLNFVEPWFRIQSVQYCYRFWWIVPPSGAGISANQGLVKGLPIILLHQLLSSRYRNFVYHWLRFSLYLFHGIVLCFDRETLCTESPHTLCAAQLIISLLMLR